MSNELATILSNAAALVQHGLDEDTAAVAGGLGTKRISHGRLRCDRLLKNRDQFSPSMTKLVGFQPTITFI